MVTATIKILDREIKITGSREACTSIRYAIIAPLSVTQSIHSSTGCTTTSLFGTQWAWDEFPSETKTAYDMELAEYVSKIPAEITTRTRHLLPSNSWMNEYIPTDESLKALREARKSPEERQAELDKAAKFKADMAAEDARKKEESAAMEIEKAKLLVEYPFLAIAGQYGSCNTASANIKALLCKKFPGTKFSVRSDKFSGGDSIDVKWVDGPNQKSVDEIVNLFKGGSYDGMNDMYKYSKSAFTDLFGSSKYLSTNHSFSQEAISALLPAIKATLETAIAENKDKLYQIEGTLFHLGHDGYNISIWQENEEGSLRHICRADGEERIASVILESTAVLNPPTAPAQEPQNATTTVGVTINRNIEHNGVELKFPGKPEESVLVWLKSHKFRWSSRQKLWYCRFSESVFSEVNARFSI